MIQKSVSLFIKRRLSKCQGFNSRISVIFISNPTLSIDQVVHFSSRHAGKPKLAVMSINDAIKVLQVSAVESKKKIVL